MGEREQNESADPRLEGRQSVWINCRGVGESAPAGNSSTTLAFPSLNYASFCRVLA